MYALKESGEVITWKDAEAILKTRKIKGIVLNYEGRSNFQVRLTDVRLQPTGDYVRFGDKSGVLFLNFGREYRLDKRNGLPSGISVKDGNDFSFYIHF